MDHGAGLLGFRSRQSGLEVILRVRGRELRIIPTSLTLSLFLRTLSYGGRAYSKL